MPLNGQSIGKDVSVNINIGGRAFTIPPNAIMRWHPKPRTTAENRKPLDGLDRDAVFPGGWTFDIDVDRLDSTIDDFWAAYETAYYAGQNTGTGTIMETIVEPGGGVTQWRYTRCVFQLQDIGERKSDSVIKQALSGYCQRRLKVQ